MRPALESDRTNLGDCALKIRDRVRALTFVTNFAFFNQAIHHRGRVVKVLPVLTEATVMEVVKVDGVPLEIDEGLLALMANVGGLIGMGGRAREMPDLGGDDELLGVDAQSVEHARQHPLGPAIAIDIGVVEVVDTRVNRRLDGGGDFVLVYIRPSVRASIDPVQPSHRPAPQTDLADFDVAASELSVVHQDDYVPLLPADVDGRYVLGGMLGGLELRERRVAIEWGLDTGVLDLVDEAADR